ncbi:MAG: HlyD family efflux transporter periplasmic adaptor subunit [Myxococcota bacterium]|nr:HlyD family efflux transporter periplasmic adaptor subunit [Myxococcota bacterium]
MNERTPETDPVDDAPNFLEANAAPWAMRGLATTLIALFATALLAAVVVELPETVTSHFVLVPLHGTDPVRAPRDGTVTRVRVIEGQGVSLGEDLFVLHSESVGDRASELRTLATERRGAAESLENQRAEFESRSSADEQEQRNLTARLNDLEGMVALKRDALELTVDVVARYRELHARGLLSRTDLASYELEAKRTQLELDEIEGERDEVKAALDRLRHEAEARQVAHRETERQLREEMERAEIRIASLQDGLARSEGSKLSVAAPCEGTVLRLPVRAPGTYVKNGEVLVELACWDDPLRAKLTVPQADVARLEPGQGVKLLYDAFPHERHGVRFGTLRWVSPASIEENGTRVFRALADVDDESIVVKGKERHLMAGMGGRAKIVVGRRTLLSYAFEPLQRLRESVTDAPRRSVPPGGPSAALGDAEIDAPG